MAAGSSLFGTLGRWLAGRASDPTVAVPAHGRGARSFGFAAAQYDRLTADWGLSPAALDVFLRYGLRGLVARSRSLAINNDYMKAYLRMVRRNVIGANGMSLQVQSEDAPGRLDERANTLIETQFGLWKKRGNPTTCGRYSFGSLERLVAWMLPRDGEVLLRRVRGFKNPWGYALQVLNVDQLDETYNVTGLRDDVSIRMGVEVDRFNRPLAYHIWRHNPADVHSHMSGQERVRVPADEIIHLFLSEDAAQTRGFPWGASSMRRLNMLGGFEEAALVNARVGASKMGFFTSKPGEAVGPPTGERDPVSGSIVQDAVPGTFDVLPEGYDLKEFNPKYPDGEMQPFVKGMLRGAAAGLGVSYSALSNDRESVNFSTARAEMLEERDEWRVVQAEVRDAFHSVVFADWLAQSLLTGALAPLPFSKLSKFCADVWQARGWDWVNPSDDMQANQLALSLGLTSRRRLAAARGEDFEQIMLEQKKDQETAAAVGIVLADPSTVKSAGAAAKPAPGVDKGTENANPAN
jgi:lambda family phage portal protein